MSKTQHSNQLNRQQARKLEDYILLTWEVIDREGLNRDQVARKSETELGFQVTPNNVIAAARTVGKKFPRRATTTGGASSRYLTVSRERIIAALVQYVAASSSLLLDISSELGHDKHPSMKSTVEKLADLQKLFSAHAEKLREVGYTFGRNFDKI